MQRCMREDRPRSRFSEDPSSDESPPVASENLSHNVPPPSCKSPLCGAAPAERLRGLLVVPYTPPARRVLARYSAVPSLYAPFTHSSREVFNVNVWPSSE